MNNQLLRLGSITKSFGKNEVLKDISFCIESGDVLAVMGENGAGKSTLMNIISGTYDNYRGSIYIDGVHESFTNPKEAEDVGIVMVHQELSLIPELSIAENIFLGSEPMSYGLVDFKEMNARAEEILCRLACHIDVNERAGSLQIGQQQIVEIARALAREAKILILDEPTAALTALESDELYKLTADLSSQGVGIMFISHRLDELFSVANKVIVLRDGHLVVQGLIKDYQEPELIEYMVGEEKSKSYQRKSHVIDKRVFCVKNLETTKEYGKLKDISLDVHEGEILGLTGLLGSGTGEVLKAIFSAVPSHVEEWSLQSGQYDLLYKDKPRCPQDAISQGIALLSDDRKGDGLVIQQSLGFNLELPTLSELRSVWLDNSTAQSQSLLKKFSIKCENIDQAVDKLSGGNQQKVALAKWIPLKPTLLLLNEPTRGVDIGAKTEIYNILAELSKTGVGMIIASTDLPEIMSLSDRLLIFKDGLIQAELQPEDYTQQAILTLAQVESPSVDTNNNKQGVRH